MIRINDPGARLRSLRKAAKLTQEDLASASGLTVQDIRRMEHGQLNLPFRKFFSITTALGISVDDLFWEEVTAA